MQIPLLSLLIFFIKIKIKKIKRKEVEKRMEDLEKIRKENFKKFKERHILQEKENIKKIKDKLKNIELLKLKLPKLTPQYIKKVLGKRKKSEIKEILKKCEETISSGEWLKTQLELSKRWLKAYKLAKTTDDIIELTCQGCGECIIGLVCELCGYNNPFNLLEWTKEAEKNGIKLDNPEKTLLKEYESLAVEKKKDEEMNQFILNTVLTLATCEECGKQLVGKTCEICGFDNTEHKKNTLLQATRKLMDHYDIKSKEALEVIKQRFQKLKDEGRIYTKM